MSQIAVRLTTVDGYTNRRVFKSLAGARRFAHKAVGAHPEIGGSYAISGDGVAKITVQGITLAEVFPDEVVECKSVLGRPMSDAEHEMYCDFEGSEADFRAYLANMDRSRRANLFAVTDSDVPF